MKKLVLEVDDLRVESFETHAGMEERGTVHGGQGHGDSCFRAIKYQILRRSGFTRSQRSQR
ncbi:MAG TPA: pinensin family lanthipeptide, partial [Longimicrobium sp.]